MHLGDGEAFSFPHLAKDAVKRLKHARNFVRSVVGDFDAGGKTLFARAFENNEVVVIDEVIKRAGQLIHHGNVNDVEWRMVK